MDGPRRSGPALREAAGDRGDRGEWRPRFGYMVMALAIVGAGWALALMSSPTPAPAGAGAAPQAPMAAVPTAPAAVPAATSPSAAAALAPPSPLAVTRPAAVPLQIPRMRDPNGDQTADLSDFVNPGERPTMAEVIERLQQAGVHSGLGAFSPPGTRPPLVGLAVPEGFVLPEGYVRHHQATDDGQRIEPILMLAPDHVFVDAAGQAIAVPADRVVPPELAPPGMPIRRIVIPAPADPGRPRS